MKQRGVFEKVPGLGVWWIRYADQYGKLHREKIGPKGFAIAAYQKRKTQVREGKFFPGKFRKRETQFSEVAQDFLKHSKKFKRSYSHDETRMATLLTLWGDCPLSSLSPGQIERSLSDCAKEREWTPATYNRYRALASAVFSLAIRNEKVSSNPVRGTRHKKENNARIRFLYEDEESRLLEQLRKSRPGREAEVLVALHSGMRRSEQYVTRDCPDGGLKWPHIDFQAKIITLPRSKNGEKRHVQMNSLLHGTLQKLKNSSDSPYVFPVKPPDEWFPEACNKARIPDFTWHSLRHTYASRLVMAGVDLRSVQELLGHKTISTTMRYAHLAPGHLAEAVERLVQSTDTTTGTSPFPSTAVKIRDAA